MRDCSRVLFFQVILLIIIYVSSALQLHVGPTWNGVPIYVFDSVEDASSVPFSFAVQLYSQQSLLLVGVHGSSCGRGFRLSPAFSVFHAVFPIVFGTFFTADSHHFHFTWLFTL